MVRSKNKSLSTIKLYPLPNEGLYMPMPTWEAPYGKGNPESTPSSKSNKEAEERHNEEQGCD